MEQQVGVAEQEIGLRHPLVYDDFNFCDLSAKGSLAKVLEKQKLSQRQSFSGYFDVESSYVHGIYVWSWFITDARAI